MQAPPILPTNQNALSNPAGFAGMLQGGIQKGIMKPVQNRAKRVRPARLKTKVPRGGMSQQAVKTPPPGAYY